MELASGSVKKVKDIEVGDKVITVTHDGNITPGKVTELFRSPLKQFYEITTASGLSIRCGCTHKLKTDKGWVRADQLNKSDMIAIARNGLFGWGRSNKALLKLYALVLGDGNLAKSDHRVYINSIYPEFQYEIEHLCDQLNFEWSSRADSKVYKSRPNAQPITNYSIGGSLKYTILADGNDCKSRGKHIPEWIKMQQKENLSVFLKYLFATDGWISVGKKRSEIGYSTVSHQLAKDVLFLLRKFAIIARVNKRRCTRYDNDYGFMWQIAIKDKHYVQKFISEIGIFGKRHNEKIQKIQERIKNQNGSISKGKDHIPVSITKRLTGLDIPASKKDGTSSIKKRLRGKTSRTKLQRETVRRFAEGRKNAEALYRLATNDIYWDEIKSIEPIGKQKGYDFEVEGNHNYIANGIVSHNSYGMRSWFVSACWMFPIEACIIRRTRQDLLNNHINPVKSEMRPFIDHELVKYNERDSIMYFKNGSKLSFLYCAKREDLENIQGQAFDLMGIEESTQIPEDFINVMISSCRASNTATQFNTSYNNRVLMTFNWGGISHKYHRRIFWDRHFTKDEDPNDYTFIFAPFESNKILQKLTPDYQRQLRKLPKQLQKAWIDGDPDAFTGTMFQIVEDFHQVDQDQLLQPFGGVIPDSWLLFGSLDPATGDYCSFGLYAKNPAGFIFKLFTYYVKDMPNMADHVGAIAEKVMTCPWTQGRMPTFVMSDRHAFQRRDRHSLHANDVTWDDLCREKGLYLRRADDSRIQGAMAMQYALDYKYDYKNNIMIRSPKLRFFKGNKAFNNKATIEELKSLERDAKNVEDIDQRGADHAYDETRYAIMAAFTPQERGVQPETKPHSHTDYGSSLSLDDKLSETSHKNNWETVY